MSPAQDTGLHHLIISDTTLNRLKNLALKHHTVVGKILGWALSLAETQAVIDNGVPGPQGSDTPSAG